MTESEFGERLRNYRKAKHMTQQELAERLGVSDKSVSRWENGSYPDVALLGPLAKELGVTVDDLLGTAPPLRKLERSDLQNWLSFGFAIGGGVLFFLLDLFAPTALCYLIYLGLMIYGVYLQMVPCGQSGHEFFCESLVDRGGIAVPGFHELHVPERAV